MTTPDSALPNPESIAPELARLVDRLGRARDLGEPDVQELVNDLETAYEELRTADEEVRTQREQILRLVDGQAMQRLQQERMLAIVPVAVIVTDVHGVIR